MARTLLLGLTVAAIPIVSAAAAPATPEEAARLTALFERYVGHAAPGEPGNVTVVPKGDDYAISLDVKRAVAGLGSFGITFDPWTYQATLTPMPDGTWKVVSDGGKGFRMHDGEKTLSLSSATDRFEGIYDPKLQAFSTLKEEATGSDTDQTGPNLVQKRHTDRSVLTSSAKSAAGGAVETVGHYDLTGLRGEFLSKPAPEPAAPGGNPAVPPPAEPGAAVGYVAPKGSLDVSIDSLRAGPILDLWAFLVAHPTRPSLAAAQDDFKGLVRAVIPVTDGLKEKGAVESLKATTPVGAVSAKSLAGGLDLSGLAGTGKAAATFSIADLAVPTEQLPPWSVDLVPTAIDLGIAVDGFHAAEGATAAIDAVDLKKDEVITPEQKDAVAHAFWPGSGTVTLAPSRVTTRVLDLRMEGQATVGAKPAGRVTIKGKGLDAEIAALQAQAATDREDAPVETSTRMVELDRVTRRQAQAAADPGASQVLSPLVLAKNLAKPDPDGSLVWVIEFGDGPVKVNGAPMQ